MAILDHDVLEHVVALQLADLGVQPEIDPRVAMDAIGQIARHVLLEPVLADDQGQARDLVGQEQRRLTGGVAAADDRDRVAAQTRASTSVAA